jgi:lipopolysaccharide biosynthesis regulator YciM
MSNTLKKLKIFIIIFLFISMLTGSAVLLYLIFNSSNPSLNSLLEQADDYIASGYYDSAREVLVNAYKLAEGDYFHLKVLKRIYLIAESENDWGFLKEYALLSYKEMPGNKNIIYFAAYSSLRNGDISKTWEILTETGSTRDFSSLWAEINLKYEGDELIEADKPILSLLIENDPEIFIEYGVLNNEDRLIIDAALLYMIDGRPDKALKTLQNLPEYRYYELKSFIAYDSGDVDLAVQILSERYDEIFLNKRMDLAVFLADLYLLNGDYEKSLNLYMQVVNSSTEFISNSYLNSSWLLQKQNRSEEAYELLSSYDYNDDTRFLKEIILLDLEMDNKAEAGRIIDEYLIKHPNDINAEILKLYLIDRTSDLSYYDAKLWQLYEDYPENEGLCRYIVWYLLNTERISDAELALDIFDAAKGGNYSAVWYLNARGIVNGLAGNVNTALNYLSESLILEENYRIRYNRAILFFYRKMPYFALIELAKIDRDDVENSFDLSNIYYLEAELFFASDKTDEALESCGKSLSLNPKNTRSINLMRELQNL